MNLKSGEKIAQRSDFLKRSGSLEERAFMLSEPVLRQLDIKERPVTSLRVQGGEGEDGAQPMSSGWHKKELFIPTFSLLSFLYKSKRY